MRSFAKTTALFFALWLAQHAIVSVTFSQTNPHSTAPTGAAYTPEKGSAERKALMDAIREDMKDAHLEMIFVVKFLKVKNGWAWANVNPQSPNGKEHYEPLAVLLSQKSGSWKVVAGDCSEDPDAENRCPKTRREFYGQLKKKFPEVPMEIFPQD